MNGSPQTQEHAGGPATSEDFETRWRSRFQEFAEAREDDAGIAGWSRAGLDARVRQFLRLYDPPPEAVRWLDAGCGAGTYARILRSRGLEVIGTDYSWPTVRKAVLRDDGASARYAVADVRRLPFRDGTFDGALCLGVMQALSRSDDAVAALAAVVRPGGELWVDALNRWCVVNLFDTLRRRVAGRRQHLRYESPGRLARLLRSAGFERVRIHWLPLLPSRLKSMQPLVELPPARWLFRYVPFAGLVLCHSFIVTGERRSGVQG